MAARSVGWLPDTTAVLLLATDSVTHVLVGKTETEYRTQVATPIDLIPHLLAAATYLRTVSYFAKHPPDRTCKAERPDMVELRHQDILPGHVTPE